MTRRRETMKHGLHTPTPLYGLVEWPITICQRKPSVLESNAENVETGWKDRHFVCDKLIKSRLFDVTF
ncbi:hypothetical protein LY78DRAFT_353740 [Colletotrichum sublineola]|nr:hypothetical protein LY78DRAFT_353740 [Colletotrichum sublineola]